MSSSMPQKFVEIITSDDDDSDEEIQFVPYVKPPPPVVDLLVSSEDESFSDYQDYTSGNTRKKKSKPIFSDSNKQLSAAKCDRHDDPSPVADENLFSFSDTPPSAGNAGQIERMVIHTVDAVTDAGRERESDACINIEQIVVGDNQSLRNVGGSSSLVDDDGLQHLPQSTEASVPLSRVVVSSSSIFEPNNDVLGELSSVSAVNGTAIRVIGPVAVDKCGTATDAQIIAAKLGNNNSRGGEKQGQDGVQWLLPHASGQVKKVSPTKRKRNAANNTPAVASTDPPASTSTSPRKVLRPRVTKQQKARQRTNEEINKFLTTLGIFEPNESPPPNPKRIRKSRAKHPIPIPFLPEYEALSLVPPPPPDPDSDITILDMGTPPIPVVASTAVPVPVSQLIEKASPTVIEKCNSQQSNQAEIMDISIANQIQKDTLPTESLRNQSRFSDAFQEPILTRTERAHLSFNITSVLNSELPEREPTPTNTNIGEDNISTSSAVSSIQSPGRKHSSTKRGKHHRSRPTTPSMAATSGTAISVPSSTLPGDHASIDIQSESSIELTPSYLPSHWTSGMVKFYDCTANEYMKLSKVLSNMPDNQRLWETNERKFSRPQNNRKMRCVNCNHFGHVIWQCSEKRKKPACHLCGEVGHTMSGRGRDSDIRHRCPNAVCLNCGQRQSKTISHGCPQCIYTRRPSQCELCGIVGHTGSHCPDKWRRYFSTTMIEQENGAPVVFGDKPSYQMNKDRYCAICSEKGHSFYHCRSKCRTSGNVYARQNPMILEELARRPKPKQLPSSWDGEENALSLTAPPVSISNDQQHAIDEVEEEEDVQSGSSNQTTTKKCMDPECKNQLPAKYFCFEIPVDPKDHKLMLKAQEDNKIRNGVLQNDQITVFQKRRAIHIYGDDEESRVHLLTLISKLSSAKARKDAATKASACLRSPEVITLEDDDKDLTKIEEQLTVALLESEWILMFDESLKPDGLICQLTKQFKVNISISKENQTITVENGTDENRLLAKANVVSWLECESANVKYIMQLKAENSASNTPSWSKKKNKKRKNKSRPRTRNFRKRQRLERIANGGQMMANPLAVTPISSQSQNHLPQSNNPGLTQSYLRLVRDQQKRIRQNAYETTPTNNNYQMQEEHRNNNDMFFSNNQIPFQSDGFYNNYPAAPTDFHPSFNQQQGFQEGQPQPPQFDDYVAFRFNFSADDRRRGQQRGQRNNGGRNNNRPHYNNNNNRSPYKRGGNVAGKNLLRFYNSSTGS